MTALTESVSLQHEGEVALLVIDNPPVNALSHHVRLGLFEGVTKAVDSGAKAIVILCEGRTFIAGADITEFGSPMVEPSLADVQSAMENSPIPVIAAIHGTALGGGLEIALCAHYRVAVSSAKLGLPEVKLGLLPGAGGTQRLPRVVGPVKALSMMAKGDPIPAGEALEFGLVDELVEDLKTGAIGFAQKAIDDGMPLIRIRDRDDKLAEGTPEVFESFRASIARKTRGFLAPEFNIRCIEAAVSLNFEAGIKRESELFGELMKGTQAAAQQYYFFAERAANKVPGIAKDTPQRPVNSVGVLGAGTMGGGIAMNFLNAGIPVTIVEREQDALDRGLALIRKNYERSAKRGSITQGDVETRMGLLTPSLDKNDFSTVDMLVEAVFEDLELKKTLFAEFDQICKPGCILASNTSALDLNAIAAATSRPESVIGTHFFSPANVMKLLEVVRGDKTADDVIMTTMTLAKKINKVAVLVGVCHGFVGNRMLFTRKLEANQMILEGATPSQVDRVLVDYGFPMGPFAMTDLAGLDVLWNEATTSSSTVGELLCESGRRGQKNGRGYYTYDPETRAAAADPEVEQIIRDFATSQGIEQREVSDEEVLERLLLPMVNEGAKIIEEGIAARGSDVDVVWVNGYGWPVYTGGPMFWADTMGLETVVSKIKNYHDSIGGSHWELSPLIERLASEGEKLQSATA